MLNGIVSARRAGTRGEYQGEVRLYKGDVEVECQYTRRFSGKGAKDAALKAAEALREKIEKEE